MTIHDREYYRGDGPSFLGAWSSQGKIYTWLIGINVAVFLLQFATEQRAGIRDVDGEPVPVFVSSPVTEAFDLNTDAVLHGQVWRLLTYAFLHMPGNLFHIFFNMLFLWWFGREVEELYGHREFLLFYLTAALLGGVAFAGWQLLEGERGAALGASGAITAVLVLYALHYPMQQIYLMCLIPVPIWVFVALEVAQDTYTFLSRTQTYTAVTCHLGGALFSYMYYRSGVRLVNYWPEWRMPRLSPRPKLRVYREEEEAEPVSVAVPPGPGIDEQLEAQLDAILEKVGRSGKESLTEQERAILMRASEVYKRRRN
jgi:membrane associated rhomboid family serine protease